MLLTKQFAFTWHSDFPFYNPRRDNAGFTTSLSLGIDLYRHTELNYPFVSHEEVLRATAAIRGKNRTLLFEGAATTSFKLSQPRLKDILLVKAVRESARVI